MKFDTTKGLPRDPENTVEIVEYDTQTKIFYAIFWPVVILFLILIVAGIAKLF